MLHTVWQFNAPLSSRSRKTSDFVLKACAYRMATYEETPRNQFATCRFAGMARPRHLSQPARQGAFEAFMVSTEVCNRRVCPALLETWMSARMNSKDLIRDPPIFPRLASTLLSFCVIIMKRWRLDDPGVRDCTMSGLR